MKRAILVVLALMAPVTRANSAEPAKRPNVLFIAVDDLNHWVGYLGRNAQTATPNIDRLAKKGVRFTRSYCAAPVCNPSRAALLTGLRPFTSGVYENDDDWRTVIPEDKTLISTFRKAGYEAFGAGKIYHGSYERHAEWNDYLKDIPADPQPAGDTGVGGIRFAPLDCQDQDLREWKIVQYGIDKLAEDHDKPFLLTIGLHKPHMPWNVPRKYYEQFPLESIKLPPYQENDLEDVPPAGLRMARPEGDHKAMLESGRWKEAVQAYLAAIAYADAMIGRLIDALEKSKYSENTVMVFWGDHGWHLGEKHHWRKFALWEEATRAPLIWVAPGVTTADTVSDRTVDFMTIYPTLTELCGIPTPGHVEGKSIVSLLKNPKSEWNAPALTTYNFRNHAVRSEGFRYIRYANGDEELYDETADPYEWKNLASDPKFTDIKAELAKRLPKTDAADISGSPVGGEAKEKTRARAKRKARAATGED